MFDLGVVVVGNSVVTNDDFSGVRVNKNCQLRKCWVWSETVTDVVKGFVKGYTLNCPCGVSKLGDVRADIEPRDVDVVKADMNCLDFPDNTFDTVISDPPWKINFFRRQKPFFEAVRVCKVGGRIIYNCVWRPTSKYVKLRKAIVRTDAPWLQASIIWVFEKIADVPKKNESASKNGKFRKVPSGPS